VLLAFVAALNFLTVNVSSIHLNFQMSATLTALMVLWYLSKLAIT